MSDESIAALAERVTQLEAVKNQVADNGIQLQTILLRLSAVESQLPFQRAGYSVTTIPGDTTTTHVVRTLDELGRHITTTYEVPTN